MLPKPITLQVGKSYLDKIKFKFNFDINFFSLSKGKNKKLGLSGRYSREVGLLSTSKLYTLQDRMFAFTPQVIIFNL